MGGIRFMTMKNYVFYYTNTGNSLALARKLAEDLGNSEIINMSEYQGGKCLVIKDAKIASFIFPVHAWGSPKFVNNFLDNLEMNETEYTFALIHCAGTPGDSYRIFERYLKKNNIKCDAAYEMLMPSNFLIYHNPPVGEELDEILEGADRRYNEILTAVGERKSEYPESTEERRSLSNQKYDQYLENSHLMCSGFYVNDDCTGCNICSKVCHVDNIKHDEDGKPVWDQDKCVLCFMCLHWCPAKAIQFGSTPAMPIMSETEKLNRYHHPDVKLKDIML